MSNLNQMYTVTKVAQITGVTIKTLHYYQKVGLLKPTRVGENNYRYYSDEDIKMLQEILVYRTMGFSLNGIHDLMQSQKNDTRIKRLEHQLIQVQEQMSELKSVIATIERTIKAEKEKMNMDKKDMFEGIKKEDDDVFKSMQSLTIIFSKLISAVFLICGFAAIYIYGRAYLNNQSLWGGDSGKIINLGFVFMGIGLTLFSGYTLFFTKIRKQLEIANHKQKIIKNRNIV